MPFSTEQSYLKDLGLISGASLPRDVSVYKGRYHRWPFTKAISFATLYPFMFLSLFCPVSSFKGSPEPGLLGDAEKVEGMISVLWKFILLCGEMRLTVIKNKQNEIVHNYYIMWVRCKLLVGICVFKCASDLRTIIYPLLYFL